jgi:hypothetical protein
MYQGWKEEKYLQGHQKDLLEAVDVDGRILNSVLKKKGCMICTAFIWHRIGTNGRLF